VFLLNSVEVARYLLELPPSECLLRCLSITVSSYKEFKMGDDLVRWFSPVFCHPGSPIETAAQMAFTAEIVDDLCPGTGSTIIEHFFPGALRSESLVIQILAAKLLKALIENGDGCCCEPEIVEPLIAFLPVCPTGDAASAIAALVKQSQVTVLPEAQLIIWNLCDIVQTELQVLLSESESLKEEAEDAIDTDLSVMASLVYATGSWLHFDRILILISNFFLLDPQNNEHLYRALGDLLVAMLSSRTPRYEPVVRVIINGLQAHEGALIVCSSFLEPIQGLIGSNREGFLSLGISEMLVEWCAQLLPLSECEDSLFAIGGLIANIAFVDPTVAPMCEPLSDELIKSDKVDIAFIGLEIAAALLVQNRRRPDPMTIERIMKAIGDNWVLTDRHAQLFRLALALAIHHDPPISEAVLPVLAILRDLQASFADADRDDIDVDIPSALLPLQTPIKFTSVYCDPAFETIIHGLAENKPES
jgi:hypothetical protein